MKPLFRASALAAGVAAFACGPAPATQDEPAVIAPEDPGAGRATRILGLRRLDRNGPFLADDTEHFRLDFMGLEPGAVTWSASGGEVVQRGLEVEWRLPKFKKAWLIADTGEDRATFGFDVSSIEDRIYLVNPAAVGQIYMGTDGSSYCRLAIDTSDTPHVVFRTETHRQLFYAAYTGGGWAMRLIDGPGFDRGGLISDDFDIAVSPTGVPHIAYRYETNGEIRYATISGASIVREKVSTMYNDNTTSRIGIGLDPVNQNRPVIAWTYQQQTSPYYDQPVFSYQSAANMWTERIWSSVSGPSRFRSGPIFDSAGNAWFTYTGAVAMAKWSRSMGFFGAVAINPNMSVPNVAPIALDAMNEPIVVANQDTYHRVSGNWVRTPFHNGSPGNTVDMVTFNGIPRLAMMHGNDLELLQTNSESFWLYTRADTASTPELSMAVDSGGVSHVCYTKNGNVWFQ